MTEPLGPLRVSVFDAPLTRSLLDAATWLGGPVHLQVATSVDASSRAMQQRGFDVAEMSLATYLHARFVDGVPLVALPAFTGRRLLAGHAGVRPGSRLRGAASLVHRRVAVPQYWMTSSVWHRSLLREVYGLDPAQLTWITTAAERFTQPVDGTRVDHCTDGRTPEQLVLDGDADAALGPRPRPATLDPLFRDEVAEAAHQYRRTGVVPVMHLVVLDAERTAAEPALARTVWSALLADREAARPGPPLPGLDADRITATIHGDPWAHGLSANRRAVEALLRALVADGLLPVAPPADELFLPVEPADRIPLSLERGGASAGKARP